MSIKIKNAFKYKNNIHSLMKELKDFRDKIIIKRIEMVSKEFNSLLNNDNLSVSWVGLEKSFFKIIQWIDYENDFSPWISVYFHNENIYIQAFWLKREEINMLSDNFEDFEFFDNIDLDKESLERQRVWSEIFEESWIPVEVSLNFELFPIKKIRTILSETIKKFNK